MVSSTSSTKSHHIIPLNSRKHYCYHSFFLSNSGLNKKCPPWAHAFEQLVSKLIGHCMGSLMMFGRSSLAGGSISLGMAFQSLQLHPGFQFGLPASNVWLKFALPASCSGCCYNASFPIILSFWNPKPRETLSIMSHLWLRAFATNTPPLCFNNLIVLLQSLIFFLVLLTLNMKFFEDE